MENCKCPHEILLLSTNDTKRISIKEIKRSHKRLAANLKSTSMGNPADKPLHDKLEAASRALLKAKKDNTITQLQHDCAEYQQAIQIIRHRLKDDKARIKQNKPNKPQTTSFKKEIEKILSHHYRPEGIKFKCSWLRYDISTTEPTETVLEHMGPLRQYLKTLNNRSIQALVNKRPEIAEALRK